MKAILLNILVCPECKNQLELRDEVLNMNEIISGELSCKCGKSYQIINSIPRFVPMDNYGGSFGLQWNKFKKTQIDRYNGTDISAARFYNETYWEKDSKLQGKWMLDAGCGAGRFADVAINTGAEVVAVDLSNAIDATGENLSNLENLHLIQADLFYLPFKTETFDFIYSIGVIQHTPEPKKLFELLPNYLKHGGQICLTFYPRKRTTMLYSKYLVRPITKKLPQRLFLNSLKISMPVLFPITYVLFSIPILSWLFIRAIPVATYVGEKRLSFKQKYEWAILDTFDMLTPKYDNPQSHKEACIILEKNGIRIDATLSAYEGNVKGTKN